jgi:lipoyl-dependent peroxiredoxin
MSETDKIIDMTESGGAGHAYSVGERVLRPARVGERIRGLRLERGLRLADVAALSGVSEPHLSRLEHGQRWPSVPVLLHLANIFDVDPALLLAGFDAPAFTVSHHSATTWRGREATGSGVMSGVSARIRYDRASRLSLDEDKNETAGGNGSPEALLGMAFAGSFSMALARHLEAAGFEPRMIHTAAEVHLQASARGHAISEIWLRCEAEVPDIPERTFGEVAQLTKRVCVVGRALLGVHVTLDAQLMRAPGTA